MAGRPLRQAACYAAAVAIGKGVSLLMMPILTGGMSRAEYGTLDVLQSIADVATVVLGLGLVDALYRFAAGPERLRWAGAVMLTALIGGMAALIGAEASAGVTAGFLPVPIPVSAWRLLLATVALDGFIQTALAWLRLNDRATSYVALIAWRTFCQAALSVVAIKTGFGLTGVLAAGAVAAATSALVLGWSLRPLLAQRLDWPSARTLLVYGGPLVIAGLGGFVLGSFDRLLLARAITLDMVADYAVASKLALAVALLFQPFALWWFPRRFAILAESDGQERSARAIAAGIALLIVAAVAVTLAGPVAIGLLTSGGYRAAATYLPWLALASVLQHTGDLLSIGCYHARRTSRSMIINLGAGAIALALYLTLIPGHGVFGAIIATCAAMACRALAFYAYSQRIVPLRIRWVRLGALSVVAVGACSAAPTSVGMLSQGLWSAAALFCIAIVAIGLDVAPLHNLLPAARLPAVTRS
jgi:O-antigen/teichoic acid export membrane protein